MKEGSRRTPPACHQRNVGASEGLGPSGWQKLKTLMKSNVGRGRWKWGPDILAQRVNGRPSWEES